MRGMSRRGMISENAARERARGQPRHRRLDRAKPAFFSAGSRFASNRSESSTIRISSPFRYSRERRRLLVIHSNVAKVRGFARACAQKARAGGRARALERLPFPYTILSARAEDRSKRPDRR